MTKIVCDRCGTTAPPMPDRDPLPEEWAGTLSADGLVVQEAVCPGCQPAAWYPCCLTVVDIDGRPIDLSAMPREEIDPARVSYCGYIDPRAPFFGDEWPEGWTCPQCGGTDVELVHAY